MIVRPQPSRPGSVGGGDFGFSVWDFAGGEQSSAASRVPEATNRFNMVQSLPHASFRSWRGSSRFRRIFRLHFPGGVDAPRKARSVRELNVDDPADGIAVFHWQHIDRYLIPDL
jgi:hypothetical protein